MQFLRLNKYIQLPLLMEWLSTEDFCRFDAAVCNTPTRPTFLENMNSHATFSGIDSPATKSFLKWIILRGIKIKNLAIVEPISDTSDDMWNDGSFSFSKLCSFTYKFSGTIYVNQINAILSKTCDLKCIKLINCPPGAVSIIFKQLSEQNLHNSTPLSLILALVYFILE